jgi:hypothetical protein
MLVRSIAILILAVIFNTHLNGQDYFINDGHSASARGRVSWQDDQSKASDDPKVSGDEDPPKPKDTDKDDKAAEADKADEADEDKKDSTSAYVSIFEGLDPEETNLGTEDAIRRLPVLIEETVKPGEKASKKKFEKLSYFATYDKGFAILPYDKKKTPFDMKINGWIQFRHHGFARNVDSWTDNAGVTRTVRNRNAFDIERARLSFKGTALDPRMSYFLQLDGDTDGRHGVDFFDYWWAWKFSDRFNVQFGKRKVSGSRQWLLGARRTRFIDRPMANDFFRPDRTIGLWARGKVGATGSYEAMIGNGYRTSNLPNNITDDQLTYAFSQHFDPNGDYGGQLVDFDYTCGAPLVRYGHSFVYSPTTTEALGSPLAETDFIRLADGTRLNQIGALSPGVTVSGVDVFYYGVDYAAKWAGWSVNSEVFLRWLENFESNGALPVDSLMQHGFYVEGGRFIVPQKLDFNLRYSEVDGLFGGGTEYAAGLNWYPLDNQNYKLKCSFDVSVFDGSPLNNSSSDILVGDDGTLFRMQIQAEF